MRKGWIWMIGMLMICLALPVSAYSDGGWDYEEGWETPDLSGVSVGSVSDTDLLAGQQPGEESTIRVLLNNPAKDYTFNSSEYIDLTSSNSQMGFFISSVRDNVITLQPYIYGYGISDISSSLIISIDGRKLPAIPVRIRSISLNKSSLILAKGKKAGLKVVSGKKKVSGKVTWKSSNKKVATVDSHGKVKAKKVGNTVISAVIKGQKVGCIVSVSGKKKISAVKTAQKIVRTGRYSQSRRMSSGYYDCSSLVWKAYRKNGCNFGSSSFAPTAADQAKYMDRHHKSLGKCTQKRIDSLYYQVGDVCYHIGPGNGRYKNIYHTELFVGYSFYGFDSKGKARVSLKGIRSYVGVGDPMARP